jgi:Zinc finger, ZZ type
LFLTDAIDVYPESHGRWICDKCRSSNDANVTMFHCAKCDYDLCHECMSEGNSDDTKHWCGTIEMGQRWRLLNCENVNSYRNGDR